MRARIYQPTKNAMQSGRRNEKRWVLDYAAGKARKMDPLMGWTSSGDMKAQIRMNFETQAEAEAYAKAQGLDYVVEKKQARSTKSKVYSDNFHHDRIGLWTH
jgi:ETC complex I subunit-like protein